MTADRSPADAARLEKQLEKMKAGSDVTDRLYAAVVEYVEAHGGTAVVVGGVGIMPGHRKFSYGLVVDVAGTPPKGETGE